MSNSLVVGMFILFCELTPINYAAGTRRVPKLSVLLLCFLTILGSRVSMEGTVGKISYILLYNKSFFKV